MGGFPGIPGYKIKSKLGEGGMAAVYLAIQENLKRKVAIKILKPFLLKDAVTARRFKREAETAAMLSHSNIVQIYDVGSTGNFHYIVMEYLEESLKDRMERKPDGKMHPGIALDIIEGIMKGLDYAHSRKIFHRDIKPDNIMFRQDGTPVLVDFGIARVFKHTSRLTLEGKLMGTAYYMSPEQCKAKKKIDGRSDIYSLGVVLFEMLTGEKPYKGDTPISVALKHIEEDVPELPGKLRRYQPLISRMMDKNKKERLSNLARFARLYDRIMTREMSPIPPGREPASTSGSKKTSSQQMESVSYQHQPKTTPGNQSLEKIKEQNPMKQFFSRCFDSCNNFVNSFKEYPIKNKVITVVLMVLPVILSVMIIIFLSSGNNSTNKEAHSTREMQAKKEAAAEKQTPLLIEQHSKKQQAREQEPGEKESKGQKPLSPEDDTRFREKYELACQYIEKGEYEKAEPLVKELKEIKDWEELKKLEKRINRWKDEEYEKYLSRAYDFFKKKNYYKAQLCIIQARQFKTEPTLAMKALEANIKERLKKRRRKR